MASTPAAARAWLPRLATRTAAASVRQDSEAEGRGGVVGFGGNGFGAWLRQHQMSIMISIGLLVFNVKMSSKFHTGDSTSECIADCGSMYPGLPRARARPGRNQERKG